MTKTIKEHIAYRAERYGDPSRVFVEDENGIVLTFYDIDKIPEYILNLEAKHAQSMPYRDKYGVPKCDVSFIC